MREDDDFGWFALGCLLAVGGTGTVLYLFFLQDVSGRIPVWALPFIAWSSDVWWHGPASMFGVGMGWWGYVIARNAYHGNVPNIAPLAALLRRFWTRISGFWRTSHLTRTSTSFASRSKRHGDPSLYVTPSSEDARDHQFVERDLHTNVIPNRRPEQLVVPSRQLARIVGRAPLSTTEVTGRFWAYIRKHNLHSAEDRRFIQVDEALRPIFGNRRLVATFEVTKMLAKHLS